MIAEPAGKTVIVGGLIREYNKNDSGVAVRGLINKTDNSW